MPVGSLNIVLIFVPGVVFALGASLFLTRKNIHPSADTLSWYLVALAVQLLHFTEEFLGDFVTAAAVLLGQSPYPLTDWVVFNMLAYAIFILGGLALFRNRQEWMVIPLFFVIVGVILNTIGHFLIALYVGDYFPGLYTAVLYLFIAPKLIRSFGPRPPNI